MEGNEVKTEVVQVKVTVAMKKDLEKMAIFELREFSEFMRMFVFEPAIKKFKDERENGK